MFLFRKKEMDIAAAKQFWKWFVENEQWGRSCLGN